MNYNLARNYATCVMFQVNRSSSDFWNNLKLSWQKSSDLPSNVLVTSVAELDGKVYVATLDCRGGYYEPLMYDFNKDQWSLLPELPYARFCLVAVPDKKQLFAIGGVVNNNGVSEISNKVFLWDEENRKWTTPYPNMPTARCDSSGISHGSAVIVVGGITCWDPCTMTRAVEVLHIRETGWVDKSYWSVVEQLPHVVCNAIPLIVKDELYIAAGYDDENGGNTCNMVTASLPELLQSSSKNTSHSQVWYKLADMPYSSLSINHCQDCLITFSGCQCVEKSELPNTYDLTYQSVPLIQIYNFYTNTWDCVGRMPYKYLIGRSVHVQGNKNFFIGGLTGTCCVDGDDIVTTCLILHCNNAN